MTRILAGACAAVAAIWALSGCGSGAESGTPAEDQVNAAAVSWVNQVCRTVDSGGKNLSTLPALEPRKPAATRDGLVTYLDSMSTALSDVADSITNAGPPPVSGGEAAVEQAMETISAERSALESAKSTLAEARITDEASFQQAIGQVRSSFDKLGDADGPLEDLKAHPELGEAIDRATACQALESGA